MDSSLHGITPLRQRMIDDMRMRKLAEKTQIQYIRVPSFNALLFEHGRVHHRRAPKERECQSFIAT